MLQKIEKRLMKHTWKFVWGEKQMSPVNEQMLYAPVEVGERAIFDLASRN